MSPSEADYPLPEGVRRSLRVQAWEEEAFEVPLKKLEPAFDRMEDPWALEAIGAADDPNRFRVEPDARDEDMVEAYY